MIRSVTVAAIAAFAIIGCVPRQQPTIAALGEPTRRSAVRDASIIIVEATAPDVLTMEETEWLLQSGRALAIGLANREVALEAAARLPDAESRLYASALGHDLAGQVAVSVVAGVVAGVIGTTGIQVGVGIGAGAAIGASTLVGASASETRRAVAAFDTLRENQNRRIGFIGRLRNLMEGPFRINIDLQSEPDGATLYTPIGEFPHRTRTRVALSRSAFDRSWLQLPDGRRCNLQDSILEGGPEDLASPAPFRIRCRFSAQ